MQDGNDIPSAEAAEFSRAFDLYVKLDEVKAQADAARLRLMDADRSTSALECEARERLVEATEAKVANIEAELEALKASHQGQDAEPRADEAQPVAAPNKPATGGGARTRHDDIQIEIDDVRAGLEQQGEHVTPAKVMALLRARAGRPDSCIYDTAPNGVLWTRGSSGEPEKLTMEALKKRISRGANGTRTGR